MEQNPGNWRRFGVRFLALIAGLLLLSRLSASSPGTLVSHSRGAIGDGGLLGLALLFLLSVLLANVWGMTRYLLQRHCRYLRRRRHLRTPIPPPPAPPEPPKSKTPLLPAVYHEAERQSLVDYITEAFGPISQMFFDVESGAIRLDIAVIAPTEAEDCFKLVTIGMGAWRMTVPQELQERNCAFAELCIYLPSDWRLLSNRPEDTWPFHWLRVIAHLPAIRDDWLGVGHCVQTGPLETDCDLTQLLLAWAAVNEGCSPRVLLPGGKLINFYQLVPVYDNEVTYRNQRGFSRLWQRLMSREVSPVVDLLRECCYEPETDFPLELIPFLWTQGREEWTLSLYTGEFLQEQFASARLAGDGYDWETLAKAFLHNRFPQLEPYIHFDSEEDLFFAYSAVEGALRLFALTLRDLCGDEDAFGQLLANILENEV